MAFNVMIECHELTNMDLLSKISPMVALFAKQDDKWVEVGRTEMIPYTNDPNYHPKFETPIQCEYHFESNNFKHFIHSYRR
jgi:hypothetical protein